MSHYYFKLFFLIFGLIYAGADHLVFNRITIDPTDAEFVSIYNPTSETIDLSNYAYPSAANDITSPGEYEYWNDFEDAEINPGDVYVICHGESDAFILTECDENHNPKIPKKDHDGNGLPSDCKGWNFAATDVDAQQFPFDDKGHGTHISGIISAKRDNGVGISGVSDKIKILPIRVTGSVDESLEKNKLLIKSVGARIANGIFYAVKRKVDVINLSLGWPKAMDTSYMRRAINEALANDIVVVAAAGNDNTNANGLIYCQYGNIGILRNGKPDGLWTLTEAVRAVRSMHLDEGPVIAQESFHIKSGMTLKQIVAAGQRCEVKTLVKAVKIYLTKRLDVHWGVVKEV